MTAWGLRDKSADDLPLMLGDSDVELTPAEADQIRAQGGRK
jgi:hypothetical protein